MIKQTPIKLFTFDIETTGIYDQTNQIIQFAYQQEVDQVIEKSGVIYLQANQPIPEAIKNLTKIDEAILNEKGYPYAIGLKIICNLLINAIDNGYFLAGHNIVGFDMKFILNQCDQYISDDPNYLKLVAMWHDWQHSPLQFQDGLINARKLANANRYAKGFKNFEVATRYGIEFDSEQLHDAQADIALSAQNIWHQLNEFGLYQLKQVGAKKGYNQQLN